ncbi:MAG: hypothetical protein JXQ87_08215 [Bacteroidia bacterium]
MINKIATSKRYKSHAAETAQSQNLHQKLGHDNRPANKALKTLPYKTLYVVLTLLLSTFCQNLNAATIYVDINASGKKNGTGWKDAYVKLQKAFDNASKDDEIWVAKGTYYPTTDVYGVSNPGDKRTKMFHIGIDLKVYGGFSGSETSLSERNWETNETILSGDIQISNNSSDNCYHVLITAKLSPNAIIDGFTITNGNAQTSGVSTFSNKNFANKNGGGINNMNSNVALRNLTICNNRSDGYGGGIYNENSNITIENVIVNNNSTNEYGGGIANEKSDPNLNSVVFTNNTAKFEGGAVYNRTSDAIISYGTFSSNEAKDGNAIAIGGAIANNESNPVISNSIFDDNWAVHGGAISNENASISEVVNCRFLNNTAKEGGAISASSSIKVYNSIFYNNQSTLMLGIGGKGGALLINNSSPNIINTTFYSNSAVIGGAVYIKGSSASPVIKNTIFRDNEKGGNTDVAEADIYKQSSSSLTISHCLTQENSSFSSGSGMLNNQDPLFIDEANDNFNLSWNSPVINMGDNSSFTSTGLSTDYNGNLRPYNTTVDLGAYEWVSSLIKNGGDNSATQGELTITGQESSGAALQDANDLIYFNQTGTFTETTNDLPQFNAVAARYNKSWQINYIDQSANGGDLDLSFDLGSPANSDYSYYLLTRSGQTGIFTILNNINYKLDGNKVVFSIDLNTLSSGNYYTLARSNSGPLSCLSFDGVDDYISLNNLSASLAGGDATFEGWFQAADNNSIIFAINTSGKGNKCQLSRNRVWEKTAGHAIFHNNAVTDELWHHYALVISANDSVKVYIDGALVNNIAAASLSLTSGNLISIGQEWDNLGTSQHLNGKVDEVRVWNDVRTRKEILDNMFRSLQGNEANLHAYYKFDQNAESYLPDISEENNQGTLINFGLSGLSSNWITSDAPIVPKAQANALLGPGNALDFDGNDDYVNLTSVIDPSSSDWTFEAWIYPEDLSNQYHVLLSQKDGTGTGDTYLTFQNGKPKLILGPHKTAANAISTNKWYHIAITYNLSETRQTLYIDGIKLVENVGAIDPADGVLVLGRNKYGKNNFNGKIDDLRFWSTCRTQAQVQDNMYANLNGDEAGLTAYYDFNYSSGSVLGDITGNGNDGTLNNFSGTYWKSAASREPFKTVRAGSQDASGTWKGGTAPNSSNDKLAVFHDLTLGSTGTYSRLQVNSGKTITTNADITITGEVIVNGTTSGSNKIILAGTAKQKLGGSGTLNALQINNSNDISLEGDLTIGGALTLTNGDIEINDHTLTLTGTTSHGSSSSYLKLNGTGKVKTTVGSSPVILPIGRNPYLPIIIDDGGDAEYTVGVSDKVFTDPTNPTTELSTNVVTETWTIQSSSSVNDVIVQIGWDAAEEANFVRGNSGIAYWEDGVSSAWQKPGSTTAATGSGPYFQTRTMDFSINLYYLGVGDNSSPLPVDLTYFTAAWQTNGETVILNWQTALEENNSHFEIERSFDGQTWEQVGTVAGQGTTFDITDYQFIDRLETKNARLETQVYYRLKQVDYNGDFDYSPIETLNCSPEQFGIEQDALNSFNVWPNPANGAKIYMNKVGNYSISTTSGILIVNEINVNELDVSKLNNGSYIIMNEFGEHVIFIKS